MGAVKIHVEGASGRLIGPLAIASIENRPSAGVDPHHGFKADYEPLEILAGRISAEGVGISEARTSRCGPVRPVAPALVHARLAVAS